MQAKSFMSRNVECIFPNTSIQEAARKMQSLDVGFLPICKDDRIVGTLTDRDIVLRVVAAGKDLARLSAQDVMTTDVHWCYDDQTAEEIGDYMAEKEIRRVLILDRNKRLAGVVSIGDLSKVQGQQEKTGETMREIAGAGKAA